MRSERSRFSLAAVQGDVLSPFRMRVTAFSIDQLSTAETRYVSRDFRRRHLKAI